MTVLRDSKSATGKAGYVQPRLVVYGSVRNLTGGSGGMASDGGGDMTMMDVLMSDRRAKENVVRIGTHPAGFGIYLFDYKPRFRAAFGHGRQFGAMSDEVERFVPSAVCRDQDGYARVDYARLGIQAA